MPLNALPFNPGFGAAAPAPDSALMQLLQAGSAFPQQQQQSQLDQLAVKNARQQLKAGDQAIDMNAQHMDLQRQQLNQQMQQAQREQWQQQWDFTGKLLQSRPQWASDQTMIDRVSQLAQSQGLPAPLDENGHVDVSAWQTPFTALDPKEQEKIRSDALERAPGPGRDAFLAGYAGVPTELRTAPQSFDAKSQAALMRAQAAGLLDADKGKFLAAQQTFISAKAHVVAGIANAQEQELVARAGRERAQAQADLIRANAEAEKAKAALMRAQSAIQMGGLGGKLGQLAIRASSQQTGAQRKVIDDQIGVIQKRIQTLSALSDDPANDPDINQLNDQLQKLQTQKIQLDQANADLVNYVTTNQGLVTTLQGQSGKRVQSVTNAGGAARGKFTVGAMYKGKDGSFAVYLGGDPAQAASWRVQSQP